MTTGKIDLNFNRIARLADVSDLAEVLFPGNRNQQHAFLAIWLTLKWADGGLVPNLGRAVQEHGVSKRTFERVRAKLRHLGVIDHVSRFNRQFGYREGWILSGRFATSLRRLADHVEQLEDRKIGSADKDRLLLQLHEPRTKDL
jgi:hypothetical protein